MSLYNGKSTSRIDAFFERQCNKLINIKANKMNDPKEYMFVDIFRFYSSANNSYIKIEIVTFYLKDNRKVLDLTNGFLPLKHFLYPAFVKTLT